MSRLTIPTLAGAIAFAFCAPLAFAHEASQAELMNEAKVTEAAARATALTKVPGGRVASAELEQEHGKLVWSFDIAQAGTKNVTEIQVDAKSGVIVSTEVETPKKESEEAAAEAKEKSK